VVVLVLLHLTHKCEWVLQDFTLMDMAAVEMLVAEADAVVLEFKE
jgi:hypothetical protein